MGLCIGMLVSTNILADSKPLSPSRSDQLANVAEDQSREFDKLQKAADAFFDHLRLAAPQHSKSDKIFIEREHQGRVKSFYALIARLKNNEVPNVSHEEFIASNQRFDKIYNILMRDVPDHVKDKTMKASDIRVTQKKWLRYRDAFIHFVSAKYPAISKETISVLLTNERSIVLEKLLQTLQTQS